MYYDEKNIFLIKPLWLFILISSSILIISSCIKNHPHKTPPIAKNGKLDLTSWNLKKDGPVKLNGQWEFFWMRYLAAKDFKNAETPKRSGYIKTPGVWNGYRIGTKKITGIGFATYRLKIFFNKKKINKYDSNNSFAIKLPDISSAYNLFINGKKITSVGTIGNSAQTTIPKNYPHVVVFKQKNNKVEIIFQIANFHQKKGGLWHAIQFGTEEDIRNTRERSLTFELFIFGSLFIMGLYHLGLFILRKKDKSPLYLGIFCLLISLRILVTGEYYLTHLVPIESWELIRKLTALTFYTATVFFIMFIRSLFPEEFSKIIYKICASIGIIYSIIVIITPANVYTYTVTSFQIITILACIYSIFILIIASIRGRKGAIVFLGGFFVLFLSVLNDILYHNGIIITGDFVSIGLFVFIFSQAYLLSYRFSRAFKTVENLSNELKLKSNDLEEKNIKLIELDKLKDEFLANTSHELKTPLTGIIGIAESMLDGIAGELTKKATANLYTIIYSGRRLSNLVNDILDFSKLKNQELELQIKPVDVYAITDLVLLLSKALIGKKEIALHNQISPEVPFVEADEDRLQQILYNLIGNAIKFTELGSVNISTETVNDMLEISVTDTGVGIPENNLDRIFESFEQGDGSIA